jgi:hypothetical protein
LAAAADIPALGSWLMSDEGRGDPGVCQWINFLAAHYAQFRIIQELFPKVNPGRQSMKDQSCILTNPEEMLVIANHLFLLRSHGVEGTVLECGCFKGYSSCCLSIACRRLGYPLIIADSFAGLPPVPDEVGEDNYYQAGDFAGARVEVEQNLRTFGDPVGVELVEGWFSATLKGWSRPLALLWLDVDLWSSTMDVLNPCLPALDPRGAVFSHEFLADYIKDSKIIERNAAAGAIAQVMREHDPDYRAIFARGNLAIVGRRTALGLQSCRLVNELIPSLSPIGVPWKAVTRSRLSRFTLKAARRAGLFSKHAR